jgi:5-methylthioadenosine/S-adenosylhomocysteine deaminase
MSYILADGWVVTMNGRREILEKGSILVRRDRIAGIGTRNKLLHANPDCQVIDCSDSIVIPGMINTHTHLFQTLLKGLGDDMPLKQWFTCMTAPSAVHLKRDDVHIAALQGCIESIWSGVTTLVDFMYVHPQPGLTEAVIEAYDEAGMRGFVCRGFITTGGEQGVPLQLIEPSEQAIADARSLIRRYNKPDGRIQVGIAPCMIWTVDAESLRATRALSDETGALITTHVAETSFEIVHSQQCYGMTDTEYLSELGFLNPNVLAVHCVQCSSKDIGLLKHHDVKVSHNPCSNMYLASGLPPIPEMLSAGLTVGLGADGPASSNNHNLFQAMKFAALMQKGFHRDATIMTAEKVLEMATIDGATAVGLEAQIGSIEVGKKADIAIVDCSDPFMAPIHNPVSAMAYSALGHEVRTVLIDGQLVMSDRVMPRLDIGSVRRSAQRAADELAKRAGVDSLKHRTWPMGMN